jgi:hypothetical protein
MSLPNIFTKSVSDKLIDRINALLPMSKAQWGKMGVAEMLAHCNVAYEMEYETKHPKPNFFMKLILKMFVKNSVVNESPYKKNAQTDPAFIIKQTRDFEIEKSRLIQYITKTTELGEDYFDNKESHSFGKLTKNEWNNLFYKHLDHHLTQFGV